MVVNPRSLIGLCFRPAVTEALTFLQHTALGRLRTQAATLVGAKRYLSHRGVGIVLRPVPKANNSRH